MGNASGILDVAIGLVFIYLLLSLICTAITEIVEGILQKRGEFLYKGLLEMLGDPDNSGTTGHDVLNKFYKNSLIYSLYRGRDLPSQNNSGFAKLVQYRKLPSYIPPKIFVLALLTEILDGEELNTYNLQTKITQSQVLPGSVKIALKTLISLSEKNIDVAIQNIENWYSDVSERISGWYKRHAQRVAFFSALILVIAGNFDTFTIAKSLMVDSSVREKVVNAAIQYTNDKDNPCKPAANNPEKLAEPQLCYKAQKNKILEFGELGLPIGWNYNPFTANFEIGLWFQKLFGWIITAIAVSLGAPFWFDVLNKFMNVRATLKPKPTGEEKAKPGKTDAD